MIRFRHALAAATIAAAPVSGQAQVTWICTLADDAVRLVCIAEPDPWHDSGAAPPATVRVRGTDFPLDPARHYVVDLWSPPTDWNEVERLAQATLCFRTVGCNALAVAPRPSRPSIR